MAKGSLGGFRAEGLGRGWDWSSLLLSPYALIAED